MSLSCKQSAIQKQVTPNRVKFQGSSADLPIGLHARITPKETGDLAPNITSNDIQKYASKFTE